MSQILAKQKMFIIIWETPTQDIFGRTCTTMQNVNHISDVRDWFELEIKLDVFNKNC